MAAASGEDGLHDLGGDLLGIEDDVVESRVRDERTDQGSVDPRGIHEAVDCQRAVNREENGS